MALGYGLDQVRFLLDAFLCHSNSHMAGQVCQVPVALLPCLADWWIQSQSIIKWRAWKFHARLLVSVASWDAPQSDIAEHLPSLRGSASTIQWTNSWREVTTSEINNSLVWRVNGQQRHGSLICIFILWFIFDQSESSYWLFTMCLSLLSFWIKQCIAFNMSIVRA